MRQPTKDEAQSIDLTHVNAEIAAGEHDLFVLSLRRKYGIYGAGKELSEAVLSEGERLRLVGLDADTKTRGVEAKLAIAHLRRECQAPKDALLVDGKWLSPITKRPYESD